MVSNDLTLMVLSLALAYAPIIQSVLDIIKMLIQRRRDASQRG